MRIPWNKLPSFVWIIIFVVGGVALIGGFIGLFFAVATVEGFGSVLILVIAWWILRATSTPGKPTTPSPAWMTASIVLFFALMGMAIDQTGNPIYNQPMEWLFCPEDSQLERREEIYSYRPGETTITQNFACVDPREDVIVEEIGTATVLIYRIVQYVLIGYLLMYLSRLVSWVKHRRGMRGAEA